MNGEPGRRTHPTVKSVVTMNRKSLKEKEVRLGLSQLVILIGLVTGSMAGAYYLGFFSGRRVGFEGALSSMAANVPKIPVPELGLETAHQGRDLESDVYAKLNQEAVAPTQPVDPQVMPDLGSIEKTEVEPVTIEDLGLSDPEPVAEVKPELKPELDTQTTHAKVAQELGIEPPPAAKPEVGLKPEIKDEKQAVVKVLGGEEHETSLKEELAEQVEIKPTPKPKATEVKTEAKKEKEPKKDGVNVLKAQLPKGWFAQVAAPQQMSEAEALARRLKGSGFPVVIEKADIKGSSYYRVLVGPEETKSKAETLVNQVRRERYINGAPFLRAVK